VLIVRTFWLPGRLWLYCSISLLLLLIPPAVIGGLAVLGYHLHWTLLVLDHASAMLFYASMVGLAVWSHLAGVKAGRP
jgi:hypothetical protein